MDCSYRDNKEKKKNSTNKAATGHSPYGTICL